MIRTLLAATTATLVVLATASVALCVDTVGMVSDTQGHAVSGVQILVRNSAGKILAKTQTDSQGHYRISGLAPDIYEYSLDPMGTAFKEGSITLYVGSQGVTIDWTVSEAMGSEALAADGTGSPVFGGDPFDLSPEEFAGAAVVVAGGVIGGYAAAGGFSGSSNPSSASR
jgi:hypothetical protein